MRLKRTPMLTAVYRATLTMLAVNQKTDPLAVLADDPKVFARLDADKALYARLRATAIYLMVVELDIPQAIVAEVVGISKQAVAKSVRNTETKLDDADYEAEIDYWAECLRGQL